MMCAVLDVNKPGWKDELLERLNAEEFTLRQRIDIVLARILERDPHDATEADEYPDLTEERSMVVNCTTIPFLPIGETHILVNK